jgi:hypothetical protein
MATGLQTRGRLLHLPLRCHHEIRGGYTWSVYGLNNNNMRANSTRLRMRTAITMCL